MSTLLSTVNDPTSPLAGVEIDAPRSAWLAGSTAPLFTCTPGAATFIAQMCVIAGSPTPEELETPEQEDPCVSEDPQSDTVVG